MIHRQIEFLSKHGSVTNRQARDITGIKSENAVKSEFYKLKIREGLNIWILSEDPGRRTLPCILGIQCGLDFIGIGDPLEFSR
jgi:hypothetical protein